MKILFTKNLSKSTVSKKLGLDFFSEFVEVIKTASLHVEPFDLKKDSLIFTSVNAVDSFFENNFDPNEDFLDPNYNKIYAVGLKTKIRLRKYGFEAFTVAKHANELSEFITEKSQKEKFVHFCGNIALNVLEKNLPLQNIPYRKVVVYETHLLYPKVDKTYDAVCFFSPSGVRSFAKYNSLDQMKLFSIGETTSKEIIKYTKNPIITSKESNLQDLLKLISAQNS
jgi:uroporphyrinogen-III synthase